MMIMKMIVMIMIVVVVVATSSGSGRILYVQNLSLTHWTEISASSYHPKTTIYLNKL